MSNHLLKAGVVEGSKHLCHFSSISGSFVVRLLAFNALNIDLKFDTMQFMGHDDSRIASIGCRLAAIANPLLNVNLTH